MAYYNKVFLGESTEIIVKKYNRTSFAIDMKIDLLKDLQDNDLEVRHFYIRENEYECYYKNSSLLV